MSRADDPVHPSPNSFKGPLFGMTLREYAAIQAMVGVLPHYADIEWGRDRDMARMAVRAADALIEELNK